MPMGAARGRARTRRESGKKKKSTERSRQLLTPVSRTHAAHITTPGQCVSFPRIKQVYTWRGFTSVNLAGGGF